MSEVSVEGKLFEAVVSAVLILTDFVHISRNQRLN